MTNQADILNRAPVFTPDAFKAPESSYPDDWRGESLIPMTEPRKPSEPSTRELRISTEARRAKVKEMYEKGMAAVDIARSLGVKDYLVYGDLGAMGKQRKRKSE